MLGAGLALGVLADALLRATPRGLNVPLCAGAVVIAAAALLRWGRVEATGGGRWLVFPLLGFAAAVAWRDSPILNMHGDVTAGRRLWYRCGCTNQPDRGGAPRACL